MYAQRQQSQTQPVRGKRQQHQHFEELQHGVPTPVQDDGSISTMGLVTAVVGMGVLIAGGYWISRKMMQQTVSFEIAKPFFNYQRTKDCH
jgi:hypothetical protein